MASSTDSTETRELVERLVRGARARAGNVAALTRVPQVQGAVSFFDPSRGLSRKVEDEARDGQLARRGRIPLLTPVALLRSLAFRLHLCRTCWLSSALGFFRLGRFVCARLAPLSSLAPTGLPEQQHARIAPLVVESARIGRL